MNRQNIPRSLFIIASVGLSACGALQMSDNNSKRQLTDSNDRTPTHQAKGAISIALTDQDLASEAKNVSIVISAMDGSAADNRTISEDFVIGKSIFISDLAVKTYKIVMQLLDKDAKILARGEVNDVAIAAAAATSVKITLFKAEERGRLKIEPVIAPKLAGYYRSGKEGSCEEYDPRLNYACALPSPGYRTLFEEQCKNAGFRVVNCACAELCSGRFEFMPPPIKEGWSRGFAEDGREPIDCPKEKIQEASSPSCAKTPLKQKQDEAYKQQCEQKGFNAFGCDCQTLCSGSLPLISW